MLPIKAFLDNLIFKFSEQPRGLDFSRNSYPYGEDSDNVWYERTTKKHIQMIFSYFKNKNLPILDLGCGKGYLLYQLQKMGFATTDGIEYNQDIAEIAQTNLRKLKLNNKVRIFHIDARDFDDYDSYQVIYMFHPFKEKIMKTVVQKVEESLLRTPRMFHVVYFYPVEHLLWDNSPTFIRKQSMLIEFLNTELDVYYYEHDPSRKRKAPPNFKDVLQKKLELA